MPNIKSAKKRVLVNEQKNLQNKMVRSSVKTAIKKVNELIVAGDKNAALEALKAAYKAIDMAASKGVLHKNNAANKKSGLAKKVNAITVAETPVVEEIAPVVEEVAPVVEEAPKKRGRKPKAVDAE